jgi:hypothetical protein
VIRRNTWILLVLFAALVGFAFYLKSNKAKVAAAATPTNASSASAVLFSPNEGSPTDVKLEDSTGKTVEIARNETGVWVLKAPTAVAANQGSAEAAATQVASLRVLSSVQLGFDIVGLDKPSHTMSITFSGGKTHKLAIGSVTPIQDGYYTSLDGGPVQVVDKQGLDALLPLLGEPPYAATLTPPVLPTVSPVPETPTSEPTSIPPGSTGTAPAPSPIGTPTP